MNECRNWYQEDPNLLEYQDHEWCKVSVKRNYVPANFLAGT